MGPCFDHHVARTTMALALAGLVTACSAGSPADPASAPSPTGDPDLWREAPGREPYPFMTPIPRPPMPTVPPRQRRVRADASGGPLRRGPSRLGVPERGPLLRGRPSPDPDQRPELPPDPWGLPLDAAGRSADTRGHRGRLRVRPAAGPVPVGGPLDGGGLAARVEGRPGHGQVLGGDAHGLEQRHVLRSPADH